MIWALMRFRLREGPAVVFSGIAALAAARFPSMGPFIVLPLFIGTRQLMPRRAYTMEGSLPVRGRDVVLAHMLTALVLVMAPIAAWSIAAQLAHVTSWTHAEIWFIAATATLVVLIPFAVRTGQVAPPPARLLVLSVSLLAALVVWQSWYLEGALLFSIAALIVFVAALGAAPMALHIGSRESASTAGDNSRTWAKPWWWPLLRTMPLFSLLWAFMSIMAGMAGSTQAFYFIIAISGSGSIRARLKWLTAFPVSTRLRVVACYAPVAIALLGGRGLGEYLATYTSIAHDYVGVSTNAPRIEDRWTNHTNVPLEYWERAGDAAPLITGPGGEQVAADTVDVLGLRFFNPFTSRKSSTPRFVAWQFARATEAVYGRAMTMQEYEQPSSRPERLSDRGFSAVVKWTALGALLMLLVISGELVRNDRLSRTPVGRIVANAMAFLPLLLVMGVDMLEERRRGTPVLVPLSHWALHQLERAAPHMIWIAALAGAAVNVLLFACLERLFRNSETERLPSALVAGR